MATYLCLAALLHLSMLGQDFFKPADTNIFLSNELFLIILYFLSESKFPISYKSALFAVIIKLISTQVLQNISTWILILHSSKKCLFYTNKIDIITLHSICLFEWGWLNFLNRYRICTAYCMGHYNSWLSNHFQLSSVHYVTTSQRERLL